MVGCLNIFYRLKVVGPTLLIIYKLLVVKQTFCEMVDLHTLSMAFVIRFKKIIVGSMLFIK